MEHEFRGFVAPASLKRRRLPHRGSHDEAEAGGIPEEFRGFVAPASLKQSRNSGGHLRDRGSA